LRLSCIARLPGLRVLAWRGEELLAARGYSLVSLRPGNDPHRAEAIARYTPASWRRLTSQLRPVSRLVRDGFHALVALSSGHLVAAVPGAIVTLAPGAKEFRITHVIQRGTRPLNLTAVPDGRVFWGEYFDNPERAEVHIYVSEDSGATWRVAYTFPKKTIRHVHNIVYDRWANALWVLTGDNAEECRILRASTDLREVETVMTGNQQVRAVAALPAAEGFYFASDTPFEKNHVYRLDRQGHLTQLSDLNSSVLSGCQAGNSLFFATMVEPSTVNLDRRVCLYGSANGNTWSHFVTWEKDIWPMRFFQYGNAFFPSGNAPPNLLAVTTVAVKRDDNATTIFHVEAAP
jgi:predicted DCC family thiol-disulfide oxidoreductase YuxK